MHPEEVLEFIRVFNQGDMTEVTQKMTGMVRKGKGISMCNIVQEIQDKGKEEGKAEGKEEGREEVIVGMIEADMPIEQIASIAKVSVDYVSQLKEKLYPGI